MTELSGPLFLSAVMLGFVGSGHCLGMCGGIAGALGQVTAPVARTSPLLSSGLYSVGRVTTYGVFGAIVGGFGESMVSWASLGPIFRILAGLLIIAFGFHVAGWGIGVARLERIGLHVWRRLAPLIARVGPPDRIWKLIALGGLWGWLPCGLVYSALAAAAVAGSARNGAIFMLCFGIGTMPALIVATGAAGRIREILRRRVATRAVGLLLIVFGSWTVYAALSMSHGAMNHEGMSHGRASHSEAMKHPHMMQ